MRCLERGGFEDLFKLLRSVAQRQTCQEAASSRQFLGRYQEILAADGRIEFKTDNQALFDFALEELEPAGWKLEAVTRDLHHDEKMKIGNIMTEYEQKFSAMGNPIYKYCIYR